MTRPVRAAVAALILSIALAPAALAATTGQVTDSFSINSTLSLTLDRTTIDYGAVDPGGVTSAPALDRRVVATVGGNEPSWTLTVTGSAFDRTGGGSLPASVRDVKVLPSGDWQDLPASVNGSGAGSASFEFAITPPSNATSGSYSGTITFTVSSS